MMYLAVAGGFILLLVGAELLVRGAVGIATRWGISPLVIGMTVVAMGTSAPELVVSVDAALSGAPGLALGNVVGSNIANVLLILGVSGLVRSIQTSPQAFYPDSVTLLGGSLVFVLLCLSGTLGFMQGAVLLVLFFAFLWLSYWRESHEPEGTANPHVQEVEDIQGVPKALWLMLLEIAIGMAALAGGAEMLVHGGSSIARELGVSEEVIGLTLIALGTSLPELAASVMAALRSHTDVALGNVVGSNLFNILGVAGVTATIAPLPVPDQLVRFDVWVMLASAVVVVPMLVWGWKLHRATAGVFLASYIGYIGIQHYGVGKALSAFSSL